nr:hypothetical protein GCM10020092_070850 [Actinoplanes digitatis]
MRSRAAAGGVAEEDDQVGEDVHGLAGAADDGLFRPDLPHDLGAVRGVGRRHVHDVGAAGTQPVRDAAVRQRAHRRLPLRRPRRDRRALDAELRALEVDVVQLVAVDEPAGCRVPDLRVVLPAVPEAADHLDMVRRLIEELAEQVLNLGGVEVVDPERRDRPPSEVGRLVGLGRTPVPASLARPLLT